MRGRLVAIGSAGALALVGAPAQAVASPLGHARLQGRFQMAGRVTEAVNVLGVHTGDRVNRVWTFTPSCLSGACPKITLVRNRRHGSDTILLHRTSPGSYSGAGSFYAPLKCGSKVYGHGELVPFTIKVKVTAASVVGGVLVATRVKASFVNSSRRNQTPCVMAPSHDAAKYRGRLL